MKKEPDSKKHSLLPVLLVISSVLAVMLGTFLQKEAIGVLPGYEDKPTVAVPFLLMQNQTDRSLLERSWQGEETVPTTLPGVPEVPEATDVPETTATTEPRETEPLPERKPHQEAPTIPTEPPEPVAVYGVDESYFDDALFIGDSRMVGVSYYARLGQADYFADVGMNVFTMFNTRVSDNYFEETSLTGLLEDRTYGKIYIMLGLNESGYGLDDLIQQYRQDLENIRVLQPEAKIYLLKVYGVSRGQAESKTHFAPANLTRINDAIESLADGENVICLDPRPLYEDSEGYILDEVSGDGVHPYSAYAAVLAEWLCEMTE